jgi:LmbE family N-acetylglucosaminyl deacetylase
MLIAPHPDDEALACSVVLQRAVRADAAIRILYATDGDNNPWPQRFLERKWRLGAADRERWGKLRRAEALSALRILGVHRSDACFLALPDQGLTGLLTTNCRSAFEQLAKSIGRWSPTDLLVPSTRDTHPDHSALAVILGLIQANLYPDEPPTSVWSYAVHGKSKAFLDRAQELGQSKTETRIKEQAIRSHQTQLKLSPRRFLAYAARPERFLKLESCELTYTDGPIQGISRHARVLRVKLRLPIKLMGTADATLLVVGHDAAGSVRCVRMKVPIHSFTAEVFDCHTGERLDLARYRGNAFAGEFAIPVDMFSPAHALFVKLKRRTWFFDEAGWLEVSATAAESHPYARIAASNSTNAVNFSSERAMKRFPLSRCASTIQIARP